MPGAGKRQRVESIDVVRDVSWAGRRRLSRFRSGMSRKRIIGSRPILRTRYGRSCHRLAHDNLGCEPSAVEQPRKRDPEYDVDSHTEGGPPHRNAGIADEPPM